MRKKWKQGKLEQFRVAQSYCDYCMWIVTYACLIWQPVLWGTTTLRVNVWISLLPCLCNLSQMYTIFWDTLPTKLTFIADDTIDESCCFRKNKSEGDRRPGEHGCPLAMRRLWNWMMRNKWKQGKLEWLWIARNDCMMYWMCCEADESLPLWGINLWKRRAPTSCSLPWVAMMIFNKWAWFLGILYPLVDTIDESCCFGKDKDGDRRQREHCCPWRQGFGIEWWERSGSKVSWSGCE